MTDLPSVLLDRIANREATAAEAAAAARTEALAHYWRTVDAVAAGNEDASPKAAAAVERTLAALELDASRLREDADLVRRHAEHQRAADDARGLASEAEDRAAAARTEAAALAARAADLTSEAERHEAEAAEHDSDARRRDRDAGRPGQEAGRLAAELQRRQHPAHPTPPPPPPPRCWAPSAPLSKEEQAAYSPPPETRTYRCTVTELSVGHRHWRCGQVFDYTHASPFEPLLPGCTRLPDGTAASPGRPASDPWAPRDESESRRIQRADIILDQRWHRAMSDGDLAAEGAVEAPPATDDGLEHLWNGEGTA